MLSLPLSGVFPARHSRHLFRTRTAQRGVRVCEGPWRSPAPLCPLRGDDFQQNKNHCFVVHLLWFQLLCLEALDCWGTVASMGNACH